MTSTLNNQISRADLVITTLQDSTLPSPPLPQGNQHPQPSCLWHPLHLCPNNIKHTRTRYKPCSSLATLAQPSLRPLPKNMKPLLQLLRLECLNLYGNPSHSSHPHVHATLLRHLRHQPIPQGRLSLLLLPIIPQQGHHWSCLGFLKSRMRLDLSRHNILEIRMLLLLELQVTDLGICLGRVQRWVGGDSLLRLILSSNKSPFATLLDRVGLTKIRKGRGVKRMQDA